MTGPDQLALLESRHAGLGAYLADVAGFLYFPLPEMRRRFCVGIDRLGFDIVDRACREWEAAGILPNPSALTQDHVSAIWLSPVFDIVMADCLQFFPPETVNLRELIPPPCRTLAEAGRRTAPSFLEAPYWRAVLHFNMPELYLEPFLPRGPLEGCDLACGWGRVALTLPTYDGRRVHCCDLTPKNLALLSRLAAKAGVSAHLIPCRCDVTGLPFQDTSLDFFLAFDIFEHLNDDALDQCGREILRTAKPGAVLYTETPMQSYKLAVTHVQDFSSAGFIQRFTSTFAHGKRFALGLFAGDGQGIASHHFTFTVC